MNPSTVSRIIMPWFFSFCVCMVGQADVFNMGGTRNSDGSWTGLASLETVPVGDPGNVGELSGESLPGGAGPDRICGAVSYNYRIGRYEVTAGQYTDFLNAVGGIDTYGLYHTDQWSSTYGCKIERYSGSGTIGNPYKYRVSADYANRPVNYVSWGGAARFANWLHNGQPTGVQNLSTTEDGAYFLNGVTSNADLLLVNRRSGWKWAITNEDEWYKAAYYKGGSTNSGYWDYATSSDNMPSNVLSNPSADPGNNANFYDYSNGYTIDSPYYRTNAGDFENSDSPYGTFDQSGNVEEWNESIMGLHRGLRGASFSYGGFFPASVRDCFYPGSGYYNVGFRVVEVPEPLSLAIMALGSLGLIRRRKA